MKRLLSSCVLGSVVSLTHAAQSEGAIKSLSTGSILYSLVMLVGITLAIILVIYILKKTQQMSLKKNSGLSVIGGLNIGGKERLIVVQINNKQILLGVTSHTITCLDKNVNQSDDSFHTHYVSNVEKLHA